MKLKQLALLSIGVYASYQAYQKRHALAENWTNLKKAGHEASHDLERIKQNLAIIESQTQNLNQISQDLTYKWRVFQKETQPRLREIQDHLAPYTQNQTKKSENN
ncbi:chemotaxis protein [Streptococcus saliviloxodontae]|uniref:Gas vesicle protein n=1 Tax=Streptococcus saliviloxodontae TaxID=1349416 RepID=A0ABS2PMG8_9STRE|nr:chemotaxis protein [Streptococcus saliviloxodontae]MBM7636482.1 gas vesicle protein [Streptococcus saliviloxodontae]